MAGEIQTAHKATGKHLYATVRNTNGSVWNVLSGAFASYLSGGIANYAINLAEQGASKYYVGDFPSTITIGIYNVTAYAAAVSGAYSEVVDSLAATGSISWDGANVIRTPSSGLFTVASLNSGQFVNVYSGQLSGQSINATVTSGLSVIASLYSGQLVNVNSGNLSGQFINAYSGANVVVPSGLSVIASLYSGQLVNVNSGQLSGQQVDANATVASGSLYLASGSLFTNTFASGVISDDIPDAVLSRNVSGVQASVALHSLGTTVLKQTSKFNALSGTTYRLDGSTVHMTQTPTTGSGVKPIVQLGVGQ